MTTAFTSSEHLQKALRAGAMDYVRKPIDEIELLARVRSALQIITSYKKIIAQKEEIQKKNDEIEDAYGIIKKKNERMMSSLRYAKRIQDALLPQRQDINRILPDSFILFRPRDVVSGDFYWIDQHEGKTIIAAVDCTGHGVPGAFMSMLGNAYLNQIIKVSNILDPAQILTQLHQFIKEALHQNQTRMQDGMAASICILDKEKQEIQFSGAKQPIVMVGNGEVEVVKGNRIAIGDGRALDKNFETHILDTSDEKMYYIFSDGYQDQFSANMRSKFMAKRFRKLLLRIHKYPIEQQEEILTNILYDWMIDTKQVDDILVIGFRA